MSIDNDKEILTHPSFGMVSFSRIFGNGGEQFFGSELIPDSFIELRINGAKLVRNLTDDRYYATDRKITVRMTHNQFAELITNLNVGGGVPCTIDYVADSKVESMSVVENRTQFVHKSFRKRMEDYARSIGNLQERIVEITKKKTLSKSDVEEVCITTDRMVMEIADNIPFFMECFQETMDKIVTEAKTTVDQTILQKIMETGLEELHKQNKLLK